MNTLRAYIVVASVILISGCVTAPQVPVSLSDTYWEKTGKKLGLIIGPIEKPGLYMEGDVRLLDYAINAGAMSSVTSHFESLDTSDYEKINKEVRDIFTARGMLVVNFPKEEKINDLPDFTDPNEKDTVYFSRKDYMGYKEKYGVENVLSITPVRIGVARPYHGFIPTGNPRAVFELKVEMVDLATNGLLWYSNIDTANHSTGNWDEPPAYPGLTNAFYASMATAKQTIINELEASPAANQKASLAAPLRQRQN